MLRIVVNNTPLRVKPLLVTQIQELLEQGYSVKQISELTNRSVEYVNSTVKVIERHAA